MDEIDKANEVALIDLEARIAAARMPDVHTDGAPFCEVCEERVPIKRRRLGYSVCVPCAERAEKIGGLYGGKK